MKTIFKLKHISAHKFILYITLIPLFTSFSYAAANNSNLQSFVASQLYSSNLDNSNSTGNLSLSTAPETSSQGVNSPSNGLYTVFDFSDIGEKQISCSVSTHLVDGVNYWGLTPLTNITINHGKLLFIDQYFLQTECSSKSYVCSLIIEFQNCTNLNGGTEAYNIMNSLPGNIVVFPLSRINLHSPFLYNGSTTLPIIQFISKS